MVQKIIEIKYFYPFNFINLLQRIDVLFIHMDRKEFIYTVFNSI